MRAKTGTTLGALLAFAVLIPSSSAAQTFPWFGGVEGRAGAVMPEVASPGLSVSAEMDAGYLWFPALRVVAGLNHVRADVDRPSVREGDFSATGGLAALRVDLLPTGRLSPVLLAGVTRHNVDADVPEDPDLERLLDGATAGATVGGGLRWGLTEVREQSRRAIEGLP